MSFCAKMALMTAMPQMPLPESSVTLSRVMPPMAMTGILTALPDSSQRFVADILRIRLGTPVWKTAPTPR